MKKTLLLITILFFFQNLTAEIIVFKDCGSKQYNYEINDYTLDLEKELMTREDGSFSNYYYQIHNMR